MAGTEARDGALAGRDLRRLPDAAVTDVMAAFVGNAHHGAPALGDVAPALRARAPAGSVPAPAEVRGEHGSAGMQPEVHAGERHQARHAARDGEESHYREEAV